ncbi:hypothetical protein [Burkholderia cenocepacia]|uniref:hypothetical protein n=1 Tax=Burkholderia cenocepacia TaxID=95486 RepID=UPI001177F9C0|nr:hypothetical protein [Burkholderia cenocepacia]MBR8078570.1 hypothetical protein [Burkholderia cenocepacia]
MSSPSHNLWQLNESAVRASLDLLCKTRIHPAFAGYLCLKHASRSAGAVSGLRPNFRSFFDTFLAVPGGPPKKPYVMPFAEQGQGIGTLWFNSNVAGSYAPSSIRAQSPMRQVSVFSGERRSVQFSLIANHSDGAKTYMLFGGTVSAAALAIFLYRDYSFRGESPSLVDLTSIFREDFGYRENRSDEASQYRQLFDESGIKYHSTELFVNI